MTKDLLIYLSIKHLGKIVFIFRDLLRFSNLNICEMQRETFCKEELFQRTKLLVEKRIKKENVRSVLFLNLTKKKKKIINNCGNIHYSRVCLLAVQLERAISRLIKPFQKFY